jgi:peptide subunit release factor 1 (eRF1)
LSQLYWLLDENRPYGTVLVDRKRARFLLSWLGEFLELEEMEFRMEPSRKKEMGPVSRPGVRMSSGTNRDVFEHHVEAQYAHFNRAIAARIGRWRAAESLDAVFLVGLSDMVKPIQMELPQELREEVMLIEKDLGWMTRAEIQERIAPMVVSRERERETRLVDELLGSERGVTMGIDETLAQLQQGKLRRLAVVKGFNGDLHQCVRCGQLDRTANTVCTSCAAERRTVTLREILPGLSRRHQVALEVVAGEAARKLQEAGGMGAWLREFEKKEYSSAAPSHA